MKKTPHLQEDAAVGIVEYHDGHIYRTWDNLDLCAKHHKTHSSLIKALIYTGNPYPYEAKPSITFDIDEDAGYDLIINPNWDGKDNRKKYVYRKMSESND